MTNHFNLGSARSVLALLVLIGNLTTVPELLAASPPPPESSRRLYDRVMEEFRHKDYPAALAGFRFFFSNSMVGPPCQPTPNTGWASANTAWGITKMPWDRSTTSFPITR